MPGVRGRCPRQALMECWRHGPEQSEWTMPKARNKSFPSNEGKSVSWAARLGVPETSKFGWESTSWMSRVSLLNLEIWLYNAYITFCKNSFSQCTWTFPRPSEVRLRSPVFWVMTLSTTGEYCIHVFFICPLLQVVLLLVSPVSPLSFI